MQYEFNSARKMRMGIGYVGKILGDNFSKVFHCLNVLKAHTGGDLSITYHSMIQLIDDAQGGKA